MLKNSELGAVAYLTESKYGRNDLSGGAWEYAAGYYKDGSISNGSSFADGKSDEYSTAYDGTNVKTAYIYGDATMETKSWHSDSADFVYSGEPFFSRGDDYDVTSDIAGVFCFSNSDRFQLRRLVSLGLDNVMCNLASERHRRFTPNYENVVN